MGNGMQMMSGPHAGRLIMPLVHDGYNGGVVLRSDDGGKSYNLSVGLHIPGIDETQIAQLPNGRSGRKHLLDLLYVDSLCSLSVVQVSPPLSPHSLSYVRFCCIALCSLMAISRNCFTPETLPPAVASCNYQAMADDRRSATTAYKPGSQFVWSTSPDGGVSWTRPQIHPDLPSPGCKGSLIAYKGSIYMSGPYSTTRRHNLTVLASDDNGEHFHRSLQITPPAPLNASDPYAYPVPGAGYSQLQCGFPMPLDCAIVWDNGQEFNYEFPYCNLSFVRFQSSDVK
jgi:hypothetical protein